jgi:hypothetical protein
MNISNGALVAKHRNRLYVSDLENYQGTYILAEDGNILDKTDGAMWFASPYGAAIYFSNQKDYDYLYCLDTESLQEKCLLQKPCANIALFEDKLLYLDEADSHVYRFDIQTGKTALLIKEEIFSFILYEGLLYGAYAKGLLEFDLRSGRSKLLTNHIPLCLNYIATGLVFSDRSKDCLLSGLEAGQREPQKINHIKTQSLIADENYIYAANLLDNSSIVRVDMASGETIRFCGEKADKLHIIEDHLYFLNQNDKNAWHRMPLSGGRSMRLLPPI